MARSIGDTLEAIAEAVEAASGSFEVVSNSAYIATEATVATLATEATAATLATEATVATLATEATAATLATEATVATLATEATLGTLFTTTDAEGLLKDGTDTAISVLKDIAGAGNPVMGSDALGQDAYAMIVTAPARVCRHLYVHVETHPIIISLDGGTTDHFRIEAGDTRQFDGLAIAAGAEVHVKNAGAGDNYTNLVISVW